MICQCSRCLTEWCRYSTKAEPCPACGEVRIYFTHLGFISHKTHQVLINVETGEMLSADPCDDIGKEI